MLFMGIIVVGILISCFVGNWMGERRYNGFLIFVAFSMVWAAAVCLCIFSLKLGERKIEGSYDIIGLVWESHPMFVTAKNRANYVCLSRNGNGQRVLKIHTRDEYGSPKVVKMKIHRAAVLGVKGQGAPRVLVFDNDAQYKALISPFRKDLFLIIADEELVKASETRILGYETPVFYYNPTSGISPDLKRFLDVQDNADLLGLTEKEREGARDAQAEEYEVK